MQITPPQDQGCRRAQDRPQTGSRPCKDRLTEIKSQAAEIAALRDEVHTLKAREELVILQAEAAATRAAMHSIADLARRIGHLEASRPDEGRSRRD